MKRSLLRIGILIILLIQSGATLGADGLGRWGGPLFCKWSRAEQEPINAAVEDIEFQLLIKECSQIFNTFKYPAPYGNPSWDLLIDSMRNHYGEAWAEALYTPGEWALPIFQQAFGDAEFDGFVKGCDKMLELRRAALTEQKGDDIFGERDNESNWRRFWAFKRARYLADQRRFRAYLGKLSREELRAFKAECPTKEQIKEMKENLKQPFTGDRVSESFAQKQFEIIYEAQHYQKRAEFIHNELDFTLGHIQN